jgi:hypothetical protein
MSRAACTPLLRSLTARTLVAAFDRRRIVSASLTRRSKPVPVRRLLAVAVLAAAAAAPASAQTCAGFTDVLTTDSFCPSVEWVKNRGVTTGCTATAYCPFDVVTRAQMALFMNRLGTALTPVFVRMREQAGVLNLTTAQVVCVSDPVPVTGHPRTALVRGLVNLYNPGAGLDVKATVVYTTTPTAPYTWVLPATNDGNAYGSLYPGVSPAYDVSLHPMNAIDLAVGSTYRFAFQVATATGPGNNVNAYCENLVQVLNRNSATSPLDQAADPGPHGRAD